MTHSDIVDDVSQDAPRHASFPVARTHAASRPLEGRTLIITGGGSGIGRAIAAEASLRGARLLLVGRRLEALEAAASDCRSRGGTAITVATDVTTAGAPDQIVEMAVRRYGRLDALVNNAGAARFGPIEHSSDDDVRAMFEVNFLAPLRLIRAALAPLRRAHGAVVNVSSIGGMVATPRRAAYGALKAALNHLTRSLARELAPEVRVNAVLPGPIETPLWTDLGLAAEDLAGLQVEMVQTTPARRLGRPEEIATWVCRFIDDRSSWVTGSLLTIDGGRSS
jgi:NAD(P)-dependent dehydrogenase (short-subunit alcohol dehydrogenase family)